MLEKVKISDVLCCNKVLYKIYEQKSNFTANIGFKIFKLMKQFDEVEEYLFDLIEKCFGTVDITNMTEEQKQFYFGAISCEIELDYERIERKHFEENDTLVLNIEDIEALGIILC